MAKCLRYPQPSLSLSQSTVNLHFNLHSEPHPSHNKPSASRLPIQQLPMPQVSVLMTVYNGMPYLRDAIGSILGQTFADFEFIVVNDGSTDGTAEYLDSVEDPRLKILWQENAGTAAAANHGLRHCTGEYVARMDADDISLPHRLATQVEFLDAHREVGLVGAQMAPMGAAGVGPGLQLPTTHQAIFTALMEGRHGMAHSCIMTRRELLEQIGGYWSVPLQDAWDMMLRMGEVAELANIDQVLHHYRVHLGSLNGKGMRRMRLSIDYARECARRRQQGLPAITHTDFEASTRPRTLMGQIAATADLYSRCQYREALAEIYGNRRLRGYCRMAWAAATGPRLTWQRIGRMAETRLRRSPPSRRELTN